MEIKRLILLSNYATCSECLLQLLFTLEETLFGLERMCGFTQLIYNYLTYSSIMLRTF